MTGRLKTGGLINRSQPLTFTFNGKAYSGFEGDTLASALLANGVTLIGRSFKYHRPRGILSAGSEEPNALVTLINGAASEPNVRATMVKLYEGLKAKSQNVWPSVNYDLLSINDKFSNFLTAGFYYKTFMWPAPLWEKLYEPFIRRAAGLGALSEAPDPDTYDKGYRFCDLLIIGAGPSGLMAALTAGRGGANVILADEDFQMGGRLLTTQEDIDGQSGAAWAAGVIAELESLPNVRLMRRTTVISALDHGMFAALEQHQDDIAVSGPKQTLWQITATHSILAAGAIERPMAFGDNDRPGIMLAGATRSYAGRYGVDMGERAVVFANNDEGWDTARALSNLGTEVSVVDPRDAVPDLAGVRHIKDKIERATGGKHVNGAKLLSGETLPTDLIAMAGGWSPAIHLTCHKRGRPIWNEAKSCFVANPKDITHGMKIVGAAAGNFSTHAALKDGRDAARALGFKPTQTPLPKSEDRPFAASSMFWVKSKKRSWVDFQNDVTTKDITLAHQEGFIAVEHLKRYTTLGMATDQGKTSNIIGLAVMADATGKTIAETGTTIFRPPYTPVPIGALAGSARGEHFHPTRTTPSHKFAEELGAVFVNTGNWKRAQWLPQGTETFWRDSVDREVLSTRGSVGICDVTTLGKIDVQGKDAGKFLNRVYANTFSTLKVERCRYGLMLRQDGLAMDDGTTARFSETHYVMTTTTANAVGVYRHLEYARQCLWPDMDVSLISTTEQWAQYAVAGPNSRKLLEKVIDAEFDISNETFPYMACGEITVCGGIRARLFRLSFSGEMAFELAVPTRYGDALVRKLISEGEEFSAAMYGTEALGVMRIEKGHAAGNELNGTTTARDLGLGKMVSKKKDSIGNVLSEREGLNREDGYALVGVTPVDASKLLNNGAHIHALGAKPSPDTDEGYVSSVCYSPMLERYIGLAFIQAGDQRKGEKLRALDALRGVDVEVEIVSPHFFDPEGERLRG